MSIFPSVGSTVTRVLTNKSGTTARIEFDDGTKILVKYEALVIDADETSSAPVTESVNVDEAARKRVRNMITEMRQPRPAAVQRPVVAKKTTTLSESAYKELAQKALARQSSRQEQVFKKWESETGQHDMPAGPMK